MCCEKCDGLEFNSLEFLAQTIRVHKSGDIFIRICWLRAKKLMTPLGVMTHLLRITGPIQTYKHS